ncbi:hypothetical protein HY988_02260 [Candidatus Micrarchaeota archaeon]|nr:hypothetical protein [Candidatus Micrarchaeota archaeon]
MQIPIVRLSNLRRLDTTTRPPQVDPKFRRYAILDRPSLEDELRAAKESMKIEKKDGGGAIISPFHVFLLALYPNVRWTPADLWEFPSSTRMCEAHILHNELLDLLSPLNRRLFPDQRIIPIYDLCLLKRLNCPESVYKIRDVVLSALEMLFSDFSTYFGIEQNDVVKALVRTLQFIDSKYIYPGSVNWDCVLKICKNDQLVADQLKVPFTFTGENIDECIEFNRIEVDWKRHKRPPAHFLHIVPPLSEMEKEIQDACLSLTSSELSSVFPLSSFFEKLYGDADVHVINLQSRPNPREVEAHIVLVELLEMGLNPYIPVYDLSLLQVHGTKENLNNIKDILLTSLAILHLNGQSDFVNNRVATGLIRMLQFIEQLQPGLVNWHTVTQICRQNPSVKAQISTPLKLSQKELDELDQFRTRYDEAV